MGAGSHFVPSGCGLRREPAVVFHRLDEVGGGEAIVSARLDQNGRFRPPHQGVEEAAIEPPNAALERRRIFGALDRRAELALVKRDHVPDKEIPVQVTATSDHRSKTLVKAWDSHARLQRLGVRWFIHCVCFAGLCGKTTIISTTNPSNAAEEE